MCQTICCRCCWCNCCGSMMSGCAIDLVCCGCWSCKKEDYRIYNPHCCMCMELTGCGWNCCCLGHILCAPDWLHNWSNSKKKYYG